MSVFTQVQIELKDLGAVCKALGAMGYTDSEVEIHTSPVDVRGYHENRKAHVIVRKENLKEHSYCDLGFYKQANGKINVIGEKSFVTDQWLGQLKNEYALALVNERAEAEGYAIEEVQRSCDGIELTLVTCYE